MKEFWLRSLIVRIFCFVILFAGVVLKNQAAQIRFDFTKDKTGEIPPGFLSVAGGGGIPAEWKVIEEAVPPTLAPVLDKGRATVTEQAVLSVQSPEPRRDHFSVLLYTNEFFSDFTFTTRFKISGGLIDPMAGVVLRAQDENNYYVVRASAEGNLLWHRVVNGKSYDMLGVGVRIPIPKGVWQELRVECFGSGTRCFLDGKLVIPPVRAGAPTNGLAVNDTTFTGGRIGFWRKADTRCSFAGAVVEYTPKVPFAEKVVAEMKAQYPRLLGLKIYARKEAGLPTIVGAFDNHDLGADGTKYEADVIERATMYYLKEGNAVEVTLPLRDRNGDVAAAVKTRMTTFKGETRDTALERAMVIRKAIEERMANLQDVTQ